MKPITETTSLQTRVLECCMCSMLLFNDKAEIIYLNQYGKNELGVSDEYPDLYSIFRMFLSKDENLEEFVERNNEKEINTIVYRVNQTCFPAIVKILNLKISPSKFIYFATFTNEFAKEESEKIIKKMETEAEEANKIKDQFVANTTHELRTPLNGIKGHVNNLINDSTTSPDSLPTLDIIMKCCNNMESIINDILDFSKLSAGKIVLEEREFPIRKVIDDVLDINMIIANSKGLNLSALIDDNVPEIVIGDELRILQILNNLISNAIKFTQIGSVRIEVHKTMHYEDTMELTFFVIDTGIGIDKEGQEKLFKSFSQTDASTTRKYGGTGLGLFISKELATMMHGDISVSSSKGRGSTFIVNIQVKSPEIVSKNEYTTKTINIPTVDDEDDLYEFGSKKNLESLRNIMEKLVIAIDMGLWEKGEFFSDSLKSLLESSENSDLKKSMFRLQMAVRKEDMDNFNKYYDLVKQKLNL
ncbi:Signal transduction histidine kinase [Acetitomaculum ruminis DSM 5522]|uniref:Circadian input-output histidine kinase CikA n=1 Tax=Acetitomaculum ruminis DSM 5522 TaxID=1120918 RepID=A0A1I0WD23_9FIRM|nr:ATP-binding protein [Acetitomaculum ruminis]SFA86541.1 Signal transduction histidine kinase [Acetitomaculum ruminis DSM 5522]